MGLTKFIITKDVRTPYVVHTHMAHKPQIIKYKTFRTGETVTGELKMDGGKPSFVLVAKTLVIPLNAVKQLVTKEIVSEAEGKTGEKINKFVTTGNAKTKYADAAIIGAIIGASLVWFAEHKKYIAIPEQKNKLYGAAAGAGLFMYIVYRMRNK